LSQAVPSPLWRVASDRSTPPTTADPDRTGGTVTDQAAALDLIDEDLDHLDFTCAPEQLFERLDEMIACTWRRMQHGAFWQHVMTEGFDRDLYRDLMVQVFHYTRFNSLNQALAVTRTMPEQRALLRFVYRHADEELGHEMMVVHDLRSIGAIDPDDDLTAFPKVPATDALVNYLIGVACAEGAVARLGYSYWAEDVYPYIAPLLGVARGSLELTDRQMTFFVAHSDIDAGHSAEVRRVIAKVATTPQDHDAIYRVAETTLWLTTQLMEQTFERWSSRRDGDA
jgi:hypothetical protein